jgi:hypothetical protein
MDLFKEARWTFSESERVKYYETVRDFLIAPLLPRFGIIRSKCTEACAFVLAYRTDPESIGFSADVANPLALFADAGGLEYNDPCRICIEENFTATIEDLYASTLPNFVILRLQILAARNALEDGEQNKEARLQFDDIASKLETLNLTLTREDMVDFYSYYVARGLYGELGVDTYLENYALLEEAINGCKAFGALLGLTCPSLPSEVNRTIASQHLQNHADNAFSSVNSFGAPTPLWSKADGTGSLFKANNETGRLYPISGSGVNMSAPISSLTSFLGYILFRNELPDLSSQIWRDMVETNPMYAWFMASATPAEESMSMFLLM